jgi:hypothetical protein
MKQTSIEWLIDQLEKHHVHYDLKNTIVYEQAKEMHKQEIAQLPQQEISNEIIKEAVISFDVPDGYKVEDYSEGFEAGFEYGVEWYRKQLKQRG